MRTSDTGDDLAHRFADGDPSAPGEFVGRHYVEINRYARVMLRDATEAEDAAHDAFVRALEALGRYPAQRVGGMRLRAWLYRITLNVVRNRVRDRKATGETALPDEVVPVAPEGTDREAVMDMLAALARLPGKQREAVTLRYVQDLPFAEISAATGWPESTARTNVRRGLARLRRELTRHETPAKPGKEQR